MAVTVGYVTAGGPILVSWTLPPMLAQLLSMISLRISPHFGGFEPFVSGSPLFGVSLLSEGVQDFGFFRELVEEKFPYSSSAWFNSRCSSCVSPRWL